MNALQSKQKVLLGVALLATALAGGLHAAKVLPLLVFFVAAIALGALANLIGEATEELGSRLNPGATGVLQSALGNLPELFICIFALRAGLVTVVQTALVGSILANSLLVLGLAFFIGGLKNGTQKFNIAPARMISTLTLLSVAALTIPTLAHTLHTPASSHEATLSLGVAIILLGIFLASIPLSVKGESPVSHGPKDPESGGGWPLWLAITILAVTGTGAAFVSDWFVDSLEFAIKAMHLSEAFAGLVVVAIAGNAVENVVGIQLAAANKPDYALSVILNSSLQVALALTPTLVLLSFVVSSTPLTLVLPPLLVVILFLTALINTVIVVDGESNWLEGLVLIGLYAIVAASFWWG